MGHFEIHTHIYTYSRELFPLARTANNRLLENNRSFPALDSVFRTPSQTTATIHLAFFLHTAFTHIYRTIRDFTARLYCIYTHTHNGAVFDTRSTKNTSLSPFFFYLIYIYIYVLPREKSFIRASLHQRATFISDVYSIYSVCFFNVACARAASRFIEMQINLC